MNIFSLSKTKKGIGFTLILLGVFIAGVGIYAAPRLHAALFAYIYPPDTNVLVNRSFEPDDFFAVHSGGAITVTIDVANNEDVALRGFYYSDQVPNGWVVNTTGVSVNASPIVDYVYRQGYADQIYTGFTPHRWALEMPQGDGVFSPTHPISASSGTARIIYSMIVSGGTGSDYVIGYEAWAGWLGADGPPGAVSTAVFGYLGITKTLNADFSADPRGGAVPLTVQFTDLSTGDPTTWSWDFGDASSVSSQQHPPHTYTIPGTYTVTLTVTRTGDMHSDTVVKRDFITVTMPPLRADFAARPRLGLPPLIVTFTDLSVGDVLTRAWNFGDGGTASLPGPVHTYTALGCYTVSLTVQDVYRSDTLARPRYICVTDVVYDAYLPAVLRNRAPQRR